MRLVRFGPRGAEKPGIVDADGNIRDLSSIVSDINAATLAPASLDKLRSVPLDDLPVVPKSVRLGSCIGDISNFLCIGLNYSDHAAETNTPLPGQPIVFNKHTSAISGPNDPVVSPPGAEKLDWEVELTIVIGKP